MSTAYADLARTCRLIARRRPAWVTDPSLEPFAQDDAAGLTEVDRIVEAVRDFGNNVGRSDAAVLALVALAGETPDALTVLLQALAPILRMKLSRSVTEEYRVDALGDLVFVVCDAIERDDLRDRSRLAARLVNRAHNRGYKRLRRASALSWAPEWLEEMEGDLFGGPTVDVGDLATARADLTTFARAVEREVANGEVSVAGWETYRDHRLLRAMIRRGVASSASQRAIAARTARRLEPLVTIHLAGHAV